MSITLALGYFDGVHRGHAALLKRAAEAASERGIGAAALTFSRHPSIALGRPVRLLNTLEDRMLLIRRQGVEPLVIEFDECLRDAEPFEFLLMLKRDYAAVHLVAGYNYRFGSGGAGTAQLLIEGAAELGITAEIVPEVTVSGATVSSSAIRALIAEGRVAEAAKLLGHPHLLSGYVIKGAGLARQIGIPTANFALPDIVHPRYGVYETQTTVRGTTYPSATNVGTRPTVGGETATVETHIIGFDGDCYDETIMVEFLDYLRPERKLASLGDLSEQMRRDIEKVAKRQNTM